MTWAEKYVGIPFKEKGRDEKGLDCYGLVCLVYKNELGIDLPSYSELYENTKDKAHISKLIFDESANKWQDVDKPKSFDVVTLNMLGVPMHVGIVLDIGYMLHCAYGVGTVIERYDGMKWQNKIEGFNRYDNKQR